MKKIIILFLLIAGLPAYSQTILLKVDRKAESRMSDNGPNLLRFTHFFIRAGMIASSDNPGGRIKYGPSVNLAFGFRKKYKLGSVYSLGYELETEYTDYKFKQEQGKTVPDTLIHDMSRLDYYTLAFGFYNRFNFDPGRGNFMGKFLDIGIKGEWHYSIKSVSKDNMPDGTKRTTTVRKLGYVYNTNASAYVRLGYSHFSLFASYRLFDLFKPEYNYPDMPHVVAGFELGLY